MSFRNLISPGVGPPVLWRTSRWCLALSVACVVTAFGMLVYRSTLAPQRQAWHRYVIMTGGFLPAVLIYPIGYVIQRRTIRDWHVAGGRLCAHCGYDVSTLADPGTCPECGNTYDLEQDAPMWAEVGLKREPGTGASPS